jgi:hypothetical protein
VQEAEDSLECTEAKSLDAREQDFFKLLDSDAAIAEENAKAEANVVYSFDSYRSAVVLWLRWTGIEEHM